MTTVVAGVVTQAVEPVEPLLAHIGHREPVPHSFCGARIIGVLAPEGYPHLCAQCERMSAWDEGVLFV